MYESIAPAMLEENQKIPSLPANYVTLQQLQERRIREQQQTQRQKEDEEERRKLREKEESERKRKKEEEDEERERIQKEEEERERIQKEEEERKRIQNEEKEKERKKLQKPLKETLATGIGANRRYKNSPRTRLEGGKDKHAAGSAEVEVLQQDFKIEESAKKKKFRKRYNKKSKHKFATDKTGDLPENIPEVEIQIRADNPLRLSAGDPSRNCPKIESRPALEVPHVSVAKIVTKRGNNRTVEIVGKIEDLTIVATEKVVEPGARLKRRIQGNRAEGIVRRDKCVYGDAIRTAENASKIGDGTADGEKDREIHGGKGIRERSTAGMKDENRRARVSSEELGLGSAEKDGEIHGGKVIRGRSRAGMRDNYRRTRVSSEEFNRGSSSGYVWVKKEEISGGSVTASKGSRDRGAIAGRKGTGKTIT